MNSFIYIRRNIHIGKGLIGYPPYLSMEASVRIQKGVVPIIPNIRPNGETVNFREFPC